MILVDTSVWIDYLEARETEQSLWLRQRIGSVRVGLTDLILTEVLQGIRSDSSFSKVLDQLQQCEIFETCGEELAVSSAENYRFLRARGYTIRNSIDCVIATFCLNNHHHLLHRDRDFDAFEEYLGLRVIHPVQH